MKQQFYFTVKCEFNNGFANDEATAPTFGAACAIIEKRQIKQFRQPIAFKLVSQTTCNKPA